VPHQQGDAGGWPALLSLPEPDLPIEAETCEQVPIGTPGDGKDRLRMRERLNKCAGLRIPKPDRRIGSCTGQRMGATTVEITSSHVAMVSHPDDVVKLVKDAARAVGATQ
jgi:hypothetical protein